jgi:catechol 2,3-dioxygenase-like lactoylglutathione lyase family enzyme
MFDRIDCISIWSDNYKRLSLWYSNKLGLKSVEEFDHPEDTGILYKIGQTYLWIGQHSKVKGENKDKYRHMLDFRVASVTKAYKLLKSKGIKFIAKPFKAPTIPDYFATFSDPDGNIIQIVGEK